MKATVRLLVVTASVLAAACDPTPAPASATQSAPPFFSPLDSGVAARDAGSAVRDGGAPAGDAGVARGVTVLSSNNRLPAPWLVTDATQLARTQPLDAGTAAQHRVGQLVTLQVATMTSNTAVDADHCPNIFMGACDGFAASDSAGHIVLVDTFVLLGSGKSTCASRFDGAALSSITGVWASRLLTDGTTSYSLALTSCAGVGVGSDPVGVVTPAPSTDIQNLQARYPVDKFGGVGFIESVHEPRADREGRLL